MTVNNAVAKRITDLLREKDMTQYRLEQESGIQHGSMQCIINGRNKTVTLANTNLNRTRLKGENPRYFSKTRLQSPHFASLIFKKYHQIFTSLGKNYFKRTDFS